MSRWTSPRLIRTESTILEVAELAGADQLPELLHRRGVAVGVVAHQDEAALLGRLDELARPRRSVAASGFSTRTCLSASSAAIATARWVAAGVATTTASHGRVGEDFVE